MIESERMGCREFARVNGGHTDSRVLHAAVKLVGFDAIHRGERMAAEIAARFGAGTRAIELLLNALIAM